MPPPRTGLRERKRLDVRARIEAAAVFLVLRDGLEGTTVDAISERADVSPRTFFNYFESKDSAILGLNQQPLLDEVVTEHVERTEGASTAESVVRLLMAVMGTPLPSSSTTHRDRLEIIKRHPQVLAGQFAQLTARGELLTAAIERLLARREGHAAGPDRSAEAEVVLAMCAGAIRAALREWATGADPGASDNIERRAVALITSTARSLP